MIDIRVLYADMTLDLRLVMHTEMENDTAYLESMFAGFNAGSGRELHVFNTSHVRSMSVGDFVQVEDRWYRCASCGWDKATTEEINQWISMFQTRLVRPNNSNIDRQNRWKLASDMKWEIYKSF